MVLMIHFYFPQTVILVISQFFFFNENEGPGHKLQSGELASSFEVNEKTVDPAESLEMTPPPLPPYSAHLT